MVRESGVQPMRVMILDISFLPEYNLKLILVTCMHRRSTLVINEENNLMPLHDREVEGAVVFVASLCHRRLVALAPKNLSRTRFFEI